MMVKPYYWLLVMLAVASLSPVNARASQALLDRFFAETDTLSAQFSQRIVDDAGMTLDAAGGQLYLARPGQFRWDYFTPGQARTLEQQIVADGESIYVYDIDLEQVTKRSLDNALSQIPSLSLVQSRAKVAEHFKIFDIGVTDGVSWVGLEPNDPEAGFKQIMVGFTDATISAITMLDILGNETRLELTAVQTNPELAADVFEFSVPEGADLLEQ